MLINSIRTDMLNIEDSWKDTFLVADLYEDNHCMGVCGTISYKCRVSGKSFNGKSLNNKLWEIFTLSTDKRNIDNINIYDTKV